ncbi:MAG: hypothetical protein DME53_05170 [Verrucomicrobia bacterium]|nr:MAG: hypothetical protein DME53_05170 [Verrucomicrobiota bacterium]
MITALWVFIILLVVFAWALIVNFMVPVMYRRRCRAYQAFCAATSLIARHPGEIVLYCSLLIVVDVASAKVACVGKCDTGCIAVMRYVGTVILLPIFVLLRSFSLLFLRQFGPEYDVWASFTPPEHVWILSPHTAPPPSASLGLPPQPPSLPSV